MLFGHTARGTAGLKDLLALARSARYKRCMSLTTLATELSRLLDLRTPPVAIAFRDSAPDGMSRVERAEPAGCGYWRLAAEGRSFYTEEIGRAHV